jgi:hypothetical protein
MEEQGTLDAICGVYSIVNAAKVISHLNSEECSELFKTIIFYLNEKNNLARLLVEGMNVNEMGVVLSHLGTKYFHERRMPFRGRQNLTLDEVWCEMEEFLSEEKRAIILSFNHPYWDHWTVVNGITAKQLNLYDSKYTKKLYKSRCSLIYPPKKKRPYFLDVVNAYFLS